jgi:sec-independent protein translocase protein TatB
MLDIGFSEILVIFVLALIVLGPEKLPKVAAQVGRWLGRARAMARQFREQLEEEVNFEETRKASAAKTPPKSDPPASPPPSATAASGAAAIGASASGDAGSATPATEGPDSSDAPPGQPHQDLTNEPWPYVAPIPPPEVSDVFGDMLTPPQPAPAPTGPTESQSGAAAGPSESAAATATQNGAGERASSAVPERSHESQVHWPHDHNIPETTTEKASPDAQPTTHERGI